MSEQSQHLLHVVGQQLRATISMQTRQGMAHETTITIKRKQPGNFARNQYGVLCSHCKHSYNQHVLIIQDFKLLVLGGCEF